MKFTLLFLIALIFLGFSARSEAHCQTPIFKKFAGEVLKHQYDYLSDAEVSEHSQFSREMFNTPQEIFSQHYHLIQKARKQVLLQTWRFDHDSLGAAYLKKALQDLSEKRRKAGAQEPVDVWLFITTTVLQGHNRTRTEIINFVENNNLNSPYVRVHIGINRANGVAANHAKNLVVDHQWALITGANHSQYFNSKNYLFDSAITMTGEVVHSLNKDIVQAWRTRFPDQPSPKLYQKTKSSSCQPALFVRQRASAALAGPAQSSSANWGFVHAMAVAQKRIDIFTPNLNADTFQNAILEAISRGLEVRVILSHKYAAGLQDLPTRGGANAREVTALYRAVQRRHPQLNVCRYLKIKWFSWNGVEKHSGTKGNAHVKYMAVDDQISYFGSSNMDKQSLINSREIGLFIDSRQRARQWRNQLFEPQFEKGIDVQECGGPEEPKPPHHNDR